MASSTDPILIKLNNNCHGSLKKWVRRKLGCTVESNLTIETKENLIVQVTVKVITICQSLGGRLCSSQCRQFGVV